MKLTLIDDTTEFPLQKIGSVAGVCWNSPVNDKEKNVNRAISCIKSGHGRVLEWVNIEVIIEECSARMMRELYTHIAGTSRLQSSTRYVDETNFDFFVPPKIDNNAINKETYLNVMSAIDDGYFKLLNDGVSKEDAANVLPLGMNSKMIWKINLRSLINFCSQRKCTRAYHEIRKFANELVNLLAEKNDEWTWIATNLLVPKCEQYKYLNPNLCFCTEAQCCGKHSKVTEIV